MKVTWSWLLHVSLVATVAAAPSLRYEPGVEETEQGWAQLAEGPWAAREGLMAVSTDTGIYMTGGRKWFGAYATSDAWFSADGRNWTELPAPPFKGRAYHAMFSQDKCLFVMAGQQVSFVGNPFYNDVWRSCDEGVTWTSLGNAPWTTRAGIAFSQFKGQMVVAGGCYGSSIGGGRLFLNDVWSSADGVKWQQLTANASWSPRSGARLVVHNDRLLLLAGEVGFTPDTQLGDVWSSTDGKRWELVTASPGFSARSGHGVVVLGQRLLVIAGWVDNKAIHDLWSSDDARSWSLVSNNTWGCRKDSCGKFDFWPVVTKNGSVITMGGSNAYSTFGKMWADTWELSL